MAIPIHYFFIFFSLVASFAVYFYKPRVHYLNFFPVFLFVTLAVEITGRILNMQGKTNIPLYNFFTTAEFAYYLIVLRSIIQRRNIKRVILCIIVLYPAIAIYNIFFIQVGTFHTITYSIGCLLIVLVCIYYFLELFQLPNSVSLIREPAFWLCSGLLFFYCCSFPLFGLLNYMHDIPRVIMRNLDSVLTLLNILHYTLFAIAFLCKVNFRKFMGREALLAKVNKPAE